MHQDSNLLAILGPTNTGKTYLAFERLISYKSGIFGFPLRLLARENYDKAVKKLGVNNVALITGEEKILPKEAKFYFCTVESMPLKTDVECIAIDEIQLAADYERGHIFTDRLLNMRGSFETIFLGSLTIEKILINLFPGIKIDKRNRYSNLSFLPKNSLSKLNPRSAIIAFNINSVYEIAESLRMYKGGAAVVLGSLSPRTRNAQVEIYEDKKVDYLVATDAIGMGLNLNIDHVSFSALQKFDGRYNRDLRASELGQIAGRAGRYFNDGTFGYLKSAGLIDPLIIRAIEEHRFDSIKKIYWRNANINFDSVESVKNSLKQYPVKNFFIHKKNAEDEINFRTLIEDQEIIPYLNNANSINLLWDVCRIPDFQKIFNDSYLGLLKNIFLILITNDGILREAWLREKIMKFENYQGGIEELSVKIASIRTWTYISNQSNWVKDVRFWQEKTQQIENNLSDRLHESLTNRFVDFSASFFVNSKNLGKEAVIEVDKERTIKLNGQKYGYINGFDLEIKTSNSESLFSLNHVKKSIRTMIEDKINNFLKAPSDSLNLGQINNFKINEDINIYWGDEPIGVISKGINIFSPIADALNSEFLESDKKILITQKLQQWLNEKITNTLKPIKEPIDESISSEVRAVVYNVFNNLGTMKINEYLNTIKNLNIHDKASISKTGLRIGAKFFFMPNFLKKFPMELNALLWKIYYGPQEDFYFPLPSDGRVSFITDKEMPETYWNAIGYKCLENFVIRVDVFERIFFIARQKIKYGPFIESSDMMNPVGCNSDQLQTILKFCGFSNIKLGDNKKLFFYNPKKQQKIKNIKIKQTKEIKIKPKIKKIVKTKIDKKNKVFNTKTNNEAVKKEIKADPNSPFAVLEKLL
ncbi:helicase-related protein [Alphaproteobacteria bacterium]|nr:helicase-related protein [Alphaproteobacteria bacterium]